MHPFCLVLHVFIKKYFLSMHLGPSPVNPREFPSLRSSQDERGREERGKYTVQQGFSCWRMRGGHREAVIAGFLDVMLLKLNAKAKMDCKVSSPGWHLENLHEKHRPSPGSPVQKQEPFMVVTDL